MGRLVGHRRNAGDFTHDFFIRISRQLDSGLVAHGHTCYLTFRNMNHSFQHTDIGHGKNSSTSLSVVALLIIAFSHNPIGRSN